MRRNEYPINPANAIRIRHYIAAVAGTPLPKRVREPDRFAQVLKGAKA